MLAGNNFNDFIEKVSEAIRIALNMPLGQKFVEQMRKDMMDKNPNMTIEEWVRIKSEFMTFIFAMFIKENPQAKDELCVHVWNELRKG